MPVIPVYTTDENNIPMNDLELYINDVLVDGDFDYGDVYDFPCGENFKMELRRTLWFGATETLCNNPISTNNDVSIEVAGLPTPPTCLYPSDPHTPNSTISVNVNGNIYNLSYNYYTPSVNTMLNDIAALINADTPITLWEANVSGNCLTIRKTRYTVNSYNGQVFSVNIHREFTPQFIVTDLGVTGNQIGDPCNPLDPIDYDEHLWRLTWRERHEDYSQSILVDTDDDVPFEFENTFYIPCCEAWTADRNDNDGILEAGEIDPMYIILATPEFEGAISNFWLVKYPCSNRVCAYEMTNIPYCLYEYNFNVTPDEKQSVELDGRNRCYDYKCSDIYTVGLTVWRCNENIQQLLSHCGCGVKDLVDVDIETDVSYQQVETDILSPDLLELSIDRPSQCEYLCQDCNVYCKSYCYQEEDTIEINYVWDYPCCSGDPNTATINVYDNNVLIHSTTLTSQSSDSFEYIWQTTGLHVLTLEAITCCGTFKKTYKIYVVPCKPYDIDFDWALDCDCNYKGSNQYVKECNCVPEGETVLFVPEYTIPDCGCPEDCETIIVPPEETDVFLEQNNGDTLTADSTVQEYPSLYSTTPVASAPSEFVIEYDNSVPHENTTSPLAITALTNTGRQGAGLSVFHNRDNSGLLIDADATILFFFNNPYSLSGITNIRLEFDFQFRYQNVPFPLSYPSYATPPNFPYKKLDPFMIVENGSTYDKLFTTRAYCAFNNINQDTEYFSYGSMVGLPFITSGSATPQEAFSDLAIPVYQFVVEAPAPYTASNVYGLGFDVSMPADLYTNNQYHFQILISNVNLIVTTEGEETERCYKEYLVEWFVDDTKVKSVEMTMPNFDLKDDRLEYQFDELGCHEVRLEVSNCAGVCSQEHEVCVGESITLSKEDCYEWKIEDCKEYLTCFIDPNTPFVNTTLNIVTLPVDTEWVQLNEGYIYYDERKGIYFAYNTPSPLIIEYDNLYNDALPHYEDLLPVDISEMTVDEEYVCKKHKAILEVYDANNKLLEGYPYEVINYTGENIHISIPQDGIYYVKFRVESVVPAFGNNVTVECEYEWILIELCGIYKCYEFMFRDLQCKTECECPDEKEIAKLRDKLNRFMAFFNLLNLSVQTEFTMYHTMNSIVLDQNRIDNAETIQENIDALTKLCNGCGCFCVNDKPKRPECSKRIKAGTYNVQSKSNNGCGCNKK